MSVLVGKQAPDTVPAVLGNGEIVDSFTLSSAIKGKYGLVFFYPLDFTFVCPSELIALDNRMADFKARNVEVIACRSTRTSPTTPGATPRSTTAASARSIHHGCRHEARNRQGLRR
jgi:peroxiredoxin